MDSEGASVKVGDRFPQFSLPAHPGGEFSFRGETPGKYLVLYFYPMDDTPGCAREACLFRDSLSQFEEHDALVLGISKNNLKSHERFASKYHLPFPLLTDTHGGLRKRLGNPDGGAPISRITYILDHRGVVRHIINADGKATVPDHIGEALKVIREFEGAATSDVHSTRHR